MWSLWRESEHFNINDNKVEAMRKIWKVLKKVSSHFSDSGNFVHSTRKQIKFNDNESSVTWSKCGSTIPRLKHAPTVLSSTGLITKTSTQTSINSFRGMMQRWQSKSTRAKFNDSRSASWDSSLAAIALCRRWLICSLRSQVAHTRYTFREIHLWWAVRLIHWYPLIKGGRVQFTYNCNSAASSSSA